MPRRSCTRSGACTLGIPLSEAVGQYRAPRARPNLVSERVDVWMREVEASEDYSPNTIVRYRGYRDGHFKWWSGKSVYEIRYDALRDWVTWLRVERKQSNKSIKNVLAAFRTFYRWLRQGREAEFPLLEFPRLKHSTSTRSVMDLDDRAAAIAALPDEDRGIFLALKIGIRPSEARALTIADYDFARGVVTIRYALKGSGSGAKRGPTKTGETGDYPITGELREWIAEHVPEARRFQPDAPLFAHPRTGRPYHSNVVRQLWIEACETADVEYLPLYQAMKHTTLTALRDAGVSIDDVQALARHRDPRTTEIYDLRDDARRKRALEKLDEMERGRQTGDRRNRVPKIRKPPRSRRSTSQDLVGVVGFEPTTLTTQRSGSGR
jgi:integrase